MNPFAIAHPRSHAEASAVLLTSSATLPVLKAGGMDIVDHLKEGLMEPDLLVNVRTVGRQRGSDGITLNSAGTALRIGAATTLAEIAASDLVRRNAPALALAAGSAATPYIRNVATAAGNLLQRPRCWYYRSANFDCLKKGGHTCYAVEGENQYHAVFGNGPCHIVHPSNLAPPMVACGGRVHVVGGTRSDLDIGQLYHMPDRGILNEHELQAGEVVTHLEVDVAPSSAFYAVKEKQSFDWPLVLAAAALTLDGGRITAARICAGAVAPVPWALPGVDKALVGVAVDDASALKAACAPSIEGAKPMTGNAYKLKLLPVAVERAVLLAAGRKVEA